jgi:pyruvate,water dikinase
MLETKHILPFSNIDKSSLSLVGGKSANLGELTKAGFNVPNGFCVTTEAFKAFIKESEKMQEYYIALDKINASEMEKISSLGHNVREYIVSCEIPGDIKHEIETAWKKNGVNKAYAVRSSATAEDLPSASFAGQQDTYLNV